MVMAPSAPGREASPGCSSFNGMMLPGENSEQEDRTEGTATFHG